MVTPHMGVCQASGSSSTLYTRCRARKRPGGRQCSWLGAALLPNHVPTGTRCLNAGWNARILLFSVCLGQSRITQSLVCIASKRPSYFDSRTSDLDRDSRRVSVKRTAALRMRRQHPISQSSVLAVFQTNPSGAKTPKAPLLEGGREILER